MSIKEITRTAILIAIVFVAMALFHFNLYGTAIHLGNLVIVVISLIFKRKEAVIASAVGATLFDLVNPAYVSYAPFTFVSRLILSYLVSLSKDKSKFTQVISAAVGSLLVSAIYLVSFLLYFETVDEAIVATITDLYQVVIAVAGVFIAVPVSRVFSKINTQT